MILKLRWKEVINQWTKYLNNVRTSYTHWIWGVSSVAHKSIADKRSCHSFTGTHCSYLTVMTQRKMGMFIRFMRCNKLKMSRFKFYKWKLKVSKVKSNIFLIKNSKEIKTNIFLTINGKKDENIKILCQKMSKMMF